MWAAEEEWIKFRTTPHSGHLPSHIPTLVRDDFLPCRPRREKGKRLQKMWTSGSKLKKTNIFCMRCQVALCFECFRPWHDLAELLPAPTAVEDTTAVEVRIHVVFSMKPNSRENLIKI
jgi:hypothetical protein